MRKITRPRPTEADDKTLDCGMTSVLSPVRVLDGTLPPNLVHAFNRDSWVVDYTMHQGKVSHVWIRFGGDVFRQFLDPLLSWDDATTYANAMLDRLQGVGKNGRI